MSNTRLKQIVNKSVLYSMKLPAVTTIGALVILLGLGTGFILYLHNNQRKENKVELPVPYASQAPYGQWQAPWNEACEETSASMIDAYYQEKTLNTEENKKVVQIMIDWEKDNNLPQEDTDAKQTQQLIAGTTSFTTEIKTNPTLQEIQDELIAERPVIALVNMYKLYNEPNEGDSYHVLVITGFDDNKKVFLVNDPARTKKEYSYDTLLHALHDFNQTSKEADGTPTVLFTKS